MSHNYFNSTSDLPLFAIFAIKVLTFGFSLDILRWMHDTTINEKVQVWAFFDPSTSSGQVKIFPIAISWRRRLIKFKKLVFISTKKIGDVRIVNLVCASDSGNFELEFNTNNYLWKLKKVMSVE